MSQIVIMTPIQIATVETLSYIQIKRSKMQFQKVKVQTLWAVEQIKIKQVWKSPEAPPKKDPVANSDAAKSDGEYVNIHSSGGGVVALGGYGDETKEHGLISYCNLKRICKT